MIKNIKTIKFEQSECGVKMLMNVGCVPQLLDQYLLNEPHNTDFFEVYLLNEASGYIIIEQKKIVLYPNMVLFISPFQKRQWQINQNQLDGYYLVFQDEFLNEFFADKFFTYRLLYFYQNQHPPQMPAPKDFFDYITPVLQDIKFELENPKIDSSHLVRASLYLFLMKLNRFYAEYYKLPIIINPINNYAYQFKLELEKHFRHLQQVEDYAKLLNINRITLNKAVSTQFNTTASQLIKQRLIQEIKNKLIYEELTVSEISYQLNFSEPNHLMRFFKQYTGLTTTEFKAKYQNGSI